ncbi:hypothetical protein ACFL56_00555 [Candidatus Margulisiibacteriota bacterium]
MVFFKQENNSPHKAKDIEEFLSLAFRYYDTKDIKSSIEVIEKGLEIFPNDIILEKFLVLFNIKIGNVQRAMVVCNDLLNAELHQTVNTNVLKWFEGDADLKEIELFIKQNRNGNSIKITNKKLSHQHNFTIKKIDNPNPTTPLFI